MIRRLLYEERGYSLVEVMASIMILAIAIIPMVAMFDTGLKSAMVGSNYDKGRALANSNLEKVRALPYTDAEAVYKPVNATPSAGTPVSCDQGTFNCTVTTTYVNSSLNPDPAATTMMRVVVTVQWEGRSYTTSGLKAQ